MAEDPARTERRKKLYDAPGSKKARGEEDGGEPKKDAGPAPDDKPEGHADPAAADKRHLEVEGVLGRHAEERMALYAAHEQELRDEHNRRRGEIRAMNSRHETEHEGMGA